MEKFKKIAKIIILIILIIYVGLTFINQQKTLNQYSKNYEDLTSQIEKQKEYNEQLSKKKQDIESTDFIEDMAREKLDMYLPNEKVYMDTGY
jgi:cell division protein ftsL